MPINKGGQIAFAHIQEKVIALLEKGISPWRRGWVSLAQQSVRGHMYRGTNILTCQMQSMLRGFKDPRWITKKEVLKRGGLIHKDEMKNQILIVHWRRKKGYRTKEDEETGEKETTSFQYITVSFHYEWNVEQCEGLDLKPIIKPDNVIPPLEQAEGVIVGYKGPELVYSPAYNPVYIPRRDRVCMPTRECFAAIGDYYSAHFHELAHSTGHPTRLKRFESLAELKPFGSHDYGKEELVAEMTATFLCDHAGIASTLETNAAYLQSWLNTIKEDASLIPWAAQTSQKAVDFILGTFKEYPDEVPNQEVSVSP